MFRSLRVGHATNSSSSHSVIMHSSFDKRDAVTDSGIPDYSSDDYTFSEKETLARAILGSYLSRGNALTAHKKIEILKVIQKHKLPIKSDLSCIYLDRDGDLDEGIECPSGVALSSWIDFILSNPVVSYQNNDNYESEYLKGDIDVMGIKFGYDIKWKSDGAAIIGYDTYTGNKFRWSPEEYLKSTTPELVDVKITDYCGYGCEFCYQGSTKKGQHSKLEDIAAVFDQLKDMNCFEVAIGGGEPAHHPEFHKIIDMATERDLTFNFTAYGTDWLKNKDITLALERHALRRSYGVGISVHTERDLIKIERAKKDARDAGLWNFSLIAQTVIGATPMHVTERLAEKCVANNIPLILLGFKRTGRGEGFAVSKGEAEDVKKLLLKIKSSMNPSGPIQHGYFHLSVDTAFLDLYGDVLNEIGIPHILRTSPEGAFSMYVDAVEMTAGPSSYCDKSLMEPVGDLKQQFGTYK